MHTEDGGVFGWSVGRNTLRQDENPITSVVPFLATVTGAAIHPGWIEQRLHYRMILFL